MTRSHVPSLTWLQTFPFLYPHHSNDELLFFFNLSFQSNRKLGKTHQNVLVFYKGDTKNIKGIYGDVECGDAPEPELINGKETG